MYPNDSAVPHRKTIRRYHTPGELHELTFSCYRRLPLFANDVWRTELSQCLDAALDEAKFELAAFVVMPEHVHLIVCPHADAYAAEVSRLIARIKQPFSKSVKSLLAVDSPLWEKLIVQQRPNKTCFRFWQEGSGYDRNLTSSAAVQASLDYIHTNPVKRGLCTRAVEWRWSSTRWYLGEPPCQPYAGLPRVSGVPRELIA